VIRFYLALIADLSAAAVGSFLAITWILKRRFG
jgi:hypothetical protein